MLPYYELVLRIVLVLLLLLRIVVRVFKFVIWAKGGPSDAESQIVRVASSYAGFQALSQLNDINNIDQDIYDTTSNNSKKKKGVIYTYIYILTFSI